MTETAKRTAENIRADIIAYFENNEDIFNECIEELDSCNGYLNDDRYYYMEELNELYNDVEPIELLYRVFYGYDADSYTYDSSGNKTHDEFNPNREYFRYNGYGNLVSSDYKDYSDKLDDYFIAALLENRMNIYSIDECEELAILFDNLEAMED